jgi:hypothetical protein
MKRLLVFVALALLAAGTASAQTGQIQAAKPISRDGLVKALRINGLSTADLVQQITQRGIDFEMTPDVEAELRQAGAQPEIIKVVVRASTREKLRQLLAASGPKRGITVDFRQSEKNPFNFVGIKRDGLTNVDFFEVVIGITDNETIGFRIYPHYKDGYINIGKARDSAGLMRTLLRQSDTNFLYWGADSGGDIFAGYTFTLESGFPDRAVEVVLYSIAPLDGFVGQIRPYIDGNSAP